MKSINNSDGITFGDLKQFANNNKFVLDDDTRISVQTSPQYDHFAKDIIIIEFYEEVRIYNYI